MKKHKIGMEFLFVTFAFAFLLMAHSYGWQFAITTPYFMCFVIFTAGLIYVFAKKEKRKAIFNK